MQAIKSNIDYQLLDLGNFRKLERFGKTIVDRPEIKAIKRPNLAKDEWKKADWHFFEQKGKKGIWTSNSNAEKKWKIPYRDGKHQFQFQLKITGFKHLGIFPEQAENWEFITERLRAIQGEKHVLNLFAYTGAASVIAAKSGAVVSHVDSIKQIIQWGKENAALNGVDNIRWIQEDAKKYVARALRRNESYQGIIMDPPAFGFGPNNEKWKLENDLPDLIDSALRLLDPKNHFFLLNTYSPRTKNLDLDPIFKKFAVNPKQYQNQTLEVQSKQFQKLSTGNLIRFWR